MKIVLLCGRGVSSSIVYNKLSEKFNIEKVIIEEGVKRSVFLKRRIKKLGLFKVIGQMAFSLLIIPFLKKSSTDRIQEILNSYNADIKQDYLNSPKTLMVESVNSIQCIETLKQINPDIVVVNGTRIISSDVLNCTNARFVNMHAGITPKYRGVHGAYWAFYNRDAENAGITIHLVDEGIDTGNIIYQKSIDITEKDNFVTYPIIQTCVGVEYEIKAIEDILSDNLKTIENDLPSSLCTHPTFFQYMYARIFRNVK